MIRVFIGYDQRVASIFSVLAHSIHRRASVPVSITPLMLSQLKHDFDRERNPKQSTDFAFSRFLVPYLSGYEGWSIFMDNDMIVREDILNLLQCADDKYAVMVVKHDHKPKEKTKFLGEQQTQYEKKNWSSVMLFNNAKCKALSKDFVNTASGLQLHQFKWLENDELIGELPHKWNHLVDYDVYDPDAALVHFTSGGPYFKDYQDCDYADEWLAERDAMLFVDD